MIFQMTCYTISMNMGGLTPQVFRMAIQEMWLEYVVVFCLIFFIITELAKKLAFLCFPVALCLQVFFVGPLVRLIFRTLFRKQLAE